MAIISEIRVNVEHCTKGIYLRWWHSQGGWHYLLVSTDHEANVKVDNKDTITNVNFSNISKVESVVSKDIELTYKCALINLRADEKDAVIGMLECETVQWFKDSVWQDIDVNRQTFNIKNGKGRAYNIEFEFVFENYLDDIV